MKKRSIVCLRPPTGCMYAVFWMEGAGEAWISHEECPTAERSFLLHGHDILKEARSDQMSFALPKCIFYVSVPSRCRLSVSWIMDADLPGGGG